MKTRSTFPRWSALKAPGAVALGLLCLASTAEASLIENGSFETPAIGSSFVQYSTASQFDATNWPISAGGVTLIKGAFGGTAADGNQWLSLENNQGNPAGAISQTFGTTPGATYNLEFSYAALALQRTWTLTYDVGGPAQTVSINTVGVPNTTWSSWATETFDFTATGSTTTLSFLGDQQSGFHGPAIDNVSVTAATAVPEASEAAVIGLGMLGIALVRRRRKYNGG